MVLRFKDILLPQHRVAIVALSYYESDVRDLNDYDALYASGGTYHEKMRLMFEPYGITEENMLWIDAFRDTQETATHKLKQADILYFPGGAPDLMMARIIAMGIKDAIRSHQGIFIGSSAGAMIQFATYHISKDHEYKRFSYEEGLDLIKGFSIEVHYRRKKKQKSGMRKVFRAFRHDIYAIPDDGCLFLRDGKISLIGSARQVYDRKGILKG